MSSNKIKLLHLVKSLELGGIEKSTIIYSKYLCDKLNFVGILATNGFYDEGDFISEKIKRFYPPFEISNKIHFLKNLFFLFKIIQTNQITHIHYHHRIFIPFIYLIKLVHFKIKVIYTHHSLFKDSVNNFIYADKIIALNNATKDDLPNKYYNRVTIIPHGVSAKHTLKNVSNTPKNIGYVGRFVKSKNLIYLINTFKIINNKNPNSKLLFVGDGPMKYEMTNEIDNLGLTKNVIFLKPKYNEDEIYLDIDILVLPSEKLEGFGIVLLESMSRGIPVIAGKIDAFKELIIDEFNGLVFENNLDEKILLLINDNKLYNKISKNAITSVIDNYEIKKLVKIFIEEVYF
ncbi:MAG: glycosyltransferase family 4 protein [Bacteroidetes bacterium]|nr:glycosyltransferase family 4 protein [Bacteroidota bacterium]